MKTALPLISLVLAACGQQIPTDVTTATVTPTAGPDKAEKTTAKTTTTMAVENKAIETSIKTNYSFALADKSLLPTCGADVLNQLVYITSEDMFYVCQSDSLWKAVSIRGKDGASIKGEAGQSITGAAGLDADPIGVIIDTATTCGAVGGKLHSFYQDTNRNGQHNFDEAFIGESTVCNGEAGQSIVGPQGIQGIQGVAGQSIIGTQGIQGIQGIAGQSIIGQNGLDGKDIGVEDVGTPTVGQCSDGGKLLRFFKDANADGLKQANEVALNTIPVCAIKGDAGQSIVGAQGIQGIQGVAGQSGAQGSQGLAGATGQTGASYGIYVTSATVGNCPTGGTYLAIYNDLNHDGAYTEASESLTSGQNICNGAVGSQGIAGTDASLTVAHTGRCDTYFNWTSTTNPGGYTDVLFANSLKVVSKYTRFTNGLVFIEMTVENASQQNGLWESLNHGIAAGALSANITSSVWKPASTVTAFGSEVFNVSFDNNPDTYRNCATAGQLCHQSQGYLKIQGIVGGADGFNLKLTEFDGDVTSMATPIVIPNVQNTCARSYSEQGYSSFAAAILFL